MLGLMLPGVAQCGEWGPIGPGPCISRTQVVQGLQNAFSALTASTGDLLDFEEAVLWSDGGMKPRLIAYIPPHIASEFIPRLRQLLAGEEVEIPAGGLWIGEDITGFLPPGAYSIRVRKIKGELKMAFINAEGEEVKATQAKVDQTAQVPENVKKIPFSVTVLVGNPSKCWYVRVGPIEGGAHFEWN